MKWGGKMDILIKKNPDFDDVSMVLYYGHEKIVDIPEGITIIEEYAFGSKSEPNLEVEKIIVPSSVQKIKNFAFSNCQNLKEIDWSAPKDLEIGFDLFKNCPSLKKIVIPKSVRGLTRMALDKNATEIEVHDSLEFVSAWTFNYVECCGNMKTEDFNFTPTINVLLKNQAYKIIDGFMVNTKINQTLFWIDRSKSSVKIPGGIEKIGPFTFDEFPYFQHQVKWNDYTKTDVVPLEKIEIPKSVKRICRGAFHTCKNLKTVLYEGNSQDLLIDDEAFYDCTLIENRDAKFQCADSKKNKRTTNLMMERIALIHRTIKSGCYPNSEKLRQKCTQVLGMEVSSATISRDVLTLRDRFNAPLAYDYFQKGYYYEKDFSLTLD